MMQCEGQERSREDRRDLETNIKNLNDKIERELSLNPAANVDKLRKQMRRLRQMR